MHSAFDRAFNVTTDIANHPKSRLRPGRPRAASPVLSDQPRVASIPINAVHQYGEVRKIFFESRLVSLGLPVVLLKIKRAVARTRHIFFVKHTLVEDAVR